MSLGSGGSGRTAWVRRLNGSLVRLQAARAVAWALLLAGWAGLGSLAQTLAPGPATAFALLAVWLLALGAGVELMGRLRGGWPVSRAWLRATLLLAGLLAAAALLAVRHGGGLTALLIAALAWAGVLALASTTVRACRVATATATAGPPVGAAAAGALLAWALLGDITDFNALAPRLALGALLACLLLAGLWPHGQGRTPKTGHCRAGLFDCSLPPWAPQSWRDRQRWPLLLAALVMLPMMCSLPWMASLCRSDSVSPQWMLGVHFAAMFTPALLVLRRPLLLRAAPRLCALLLVLGALVLMLAPAATAWWGLAIAHGAAWSLGWAVRLTDRSPRPSAQASALAGAVVNALLVALLGLAIAGFGLSALAAWHLVLGLAAVLALLLCGSGGPGARLSPRLVEGRGRSGAVRPGLQAHRLLGDPLRPNSGLREVAVPAQQTPRRSLLSQMGHECPPLRGLKD